MYLPGKCSAVPVHAVQDEGIRTCCTQRMRSQILFPTLADLPNGQTEGNDLVASMKTSASSIVGSVAPGASIALATTPILTLTCVLDFVHSKD